MDISILAPTEMSMNALTTDDALAVDGDCDRVAVHVRHGDAQHFKVIVQVPYTNVLIAARSNHL